MPDECANAFFPTIALFGCIGIFISFETILLVGKIFFELIFVLYPSLCVFKIITTSSSDVFPALLKFVLDLSEDQVLENLINFFFHPDFVFPKREERKEVSIISEDKAALIFEKLIKDKQKPLRTAIIGVNKLLHLASEKGFDIVKILLDLHDNSRLVPYLEDVIQFITVLKKIPKNEPAEKESLLEKVISILLDNTFTKEEELVAIAQAIPKLNIELHCPGLTNQNILFCNE